MIYTAIWQELEKTQSANGSVRRRIKPEAVCDLFLAVSKPSNQHLLQIQLKESVHFTAASLPSARGLDITIISAGDEQHSFTIQLALKEDRFTTIFDTLVNDIIEVIVPTQSQSSALAALINRLKRWQKFLAQADPDGLSREARQGLYGELWFLREYLLPLADYSRALSAWAGPSGAHHDFLLQSCAIEVKTTGMKEPQQMIIQSERQLDDSGLNALFLFHLSIDAREGNGESLLAIIASIYEILDHDAPALDLYKDCLIEAGFLQLHASLYEKTGYYVRNNKIFRVNHDFPRIIEADLKPGVGSVRYTIAVAECRQFVVTEEALKFQLRGLNNGK